ncbi:MAG: hypothetical protein Q4D79_10210 [Propionibacteriaceae bacterium]|nr:hypothetical protein [Propionibacteriaceae bacterium]
MKRHTHTVMLVGILAFCSLPLPAAGDPGVQESNNERLNNYLQRTETQVDADGVYHYPADTELSRSDDLLDAAEFFTLEGEQEGDGCRFTISDEEENEGVNHRVETREVSFDPNTCTSVFLKTTTIDQEGLGIPQAEESTEAGWTRSGWFQVHLKDPIRLTVNWVRTHRTVSSNGTYSGAGNTGHFSQSGWARTRYNHSDSYYESRTTALFTNVAFCNPFAAIYADYTRVALTATPSGGNFTKSAAYSKSGDCAFLLSFGTSSLIGPKR